MSDRFRIAKGLVQRFTELHLKLPALSHAAGLPPGFFEQEKIHASTAEFFALWRAVEELSEDPAIGLKLGSEARTEQFSPMLIAASCSRNLRDAVQRMGRYKQITCPEEIRMHTAGDETTVQFVFTEANEEEPSVLVDNCLTLIRTLGKRGTGDRVRPIRVELMRPVKHRELFEAHYGCNIRYKAQRNALVFRTADMDLPFTTHNADLLMALGPQLESELKAHRSAHGIGEQVIHALRRTLAGKRPTLPDTARTLGMGVRTLQRRLTGVDLTFQGVLEDVRRDMAHHYLKQRMELTETAYLLGYEDANSFFRAFSNWEGLTPGEWRTRHGVAVV